MGEGGMGSMMSGAQTGGMMGGPWGAAIGGGLGLLQGQDNARKAQQQNLMNAQLMTLSPWTNMKMTPQDLYAKDYKTGGQLGLAGIESAGAQKQANEKSAWERAFAEKQLDSLSNKVRTQDAAPVAPPTASPETESMLDPIKASLMTKKMASYNSSPYASMTMRA
jgi:hypothetical protein